MLLFAWQELRRLSEKAKAEIAEAETQPGFPNGMSSPIVKQEASQDVLNIFYIIILGFVLVSPPSVQIKRS